MELLYAIGIGWIVGVVAQLILKGRLVLTLILTIALGLGGAVLGKFILSLSGIPIPDVGTLVIVAVIGSLAIYSSIGGWLHRL